MKVARATAKKVRLQMNGKTTGQPTPKSPSPPHRRLLGQKTRSTQINKDPENRGS